MESYIGKKINLKTKNMFDYTTIESDNCNDNFKKEITSDNDFFILSYVANHLYLNDVKISCDEKRNSMQNNELRLNYFVGLYLFDNMLLRSLYLDKNNKIWCQLLDEANDQYYSCMI